MTVSTAYGPGRLGLSFELFPPKSAAGEEELFKNLDELIAFRPAYVTCTYGAGGSTRQKTLDIVAQVRQRYGVAVAAHLTCVGATVDELRAFLTEAQSRGVRNIVALRGDPPKGDAAFRPVLGGLRYANELVTMIRQEFEDLGIAVAGYPETHHEAPSREADLVNLKRKVDAGADVIITQLFYCNADFFEFRQRCQQVGIRVPIVPGILPVTNLEQIKRITGLCGARMPPHFTDALAGCRDDLAAQFEVGVEFAAAQVQELVASGVPGIHFYVLNRSSATARVLRELHLSEGAAPPKPA